MKLAHKNNTTYHNYPNTPYEFFFINENEFKEICNNDDYVQRNVSFCGTISHFDFNKKIGVVNYESHSICVKFERVMASLQLKVNNGVYFIYGYIHKEKDNSYAHTSYKNVSVVCNFIRYVSDFNKEQYMQLVKERRNIVNECIEMKEQNEFWFNNGQLY